MQLMGLPRRTACSTNATDVDSPVILPPRLAHRCSQDPADSTIVKAHSPSRSTLISPFALSFAIVIRNTERPEDSCLVSVGSVTATLIVMVPARERVSEVADIADRAVAKGPVVGQGRIIAVVRRDCEQHVHVV